MRSRSWCQRLFLGSGLAVLLLGVGLPLSADPVAAADARVDWSLTIGGRDISDATSGNPLQLHPGRAVPVTVAVTARGNTPVTVRYVKIEGRVLGLAFFTYTSEVQLSASPGGSDDRRYDLPTIDLDGQANGLLPARAVLYDGEGSVVASRAFVVDVRGRLRSVYGTFGIAVAAITLLLLGSALWRLRQGQLPENRWRRATAFALPGLGVGFVLTFTMSALRWLVPAPATWTLLLLLGAAVGFAAGYLTPTPAYVSHREQADDVGGQIDLTEDAPTESSSPSETLERAERDR